MADKLHTLTSNLIKFAAGEKPSADKFNAANEYFARSLREISKAIGDIRDQGYPHSSDANKYTHLTGAWNAYEIGREEGRPLDIVNIARLIGPASNLNPKMLDFDTRKLEIISGSLMEYELSYPLKENDNITILAGGPLLTKVTTPYFTGVNQFLVRGNVVYFSSSYNGNRAIAYDTSASDIDGGANYTGASFNVIPDPNQPDKLSVVALQNEVNAYSISLGVCTHQQSGIRSQESLRLSSLNAGEYNNNIALKLPTWMWSGSSPRFTDGDAIPEGFLVLKNLTTNEVYQNASYFFVSSSQIIIRGVSLCVDHEFCIITVGTDITTSIDDLRNKMFLHKHDGSFGEPRVSVKDLVDKFTEFSTVLYGESSIPNNHFPMYLHRSGFSLDSNLNNGLNAMLGALLMGSVGFDSLNPTINGVIKNAPADSLSTGYASQPILFSSPDCSITREDDATLLIKNSNFKNIDIEAKNINLTSIAEIILNAPGGLSLNSLGGFGFINLYSSSVDVGSENLLYLHGNNVTISGGEKVSINSDLEIVNIDANGLYKDLSSFNVLKANNNSQVSQKITETVSNLYPVSGDPLNSIRDLQISAGESENLDLPITETSNKFFNIIEKSGRALFKNIYNIYDIYFQPTLSVREIIESGKVGNNYDFSTITTGLDELIQENECRTYSYFIEGLPGKLIDCDLRYLTILNSNKTDAVLSQITNTYLLTSQSFFKKISLDIKDQNFLIKNITPYNFIGNLSSEALGNLYYGFTKIECNINRNNTFGLDNFRYYIECYKDSYKFSSGGANLDTDKWYYLNYTSGLEKLITVIKKKNTSFSSEAINKAFINSEGELSYQYTYDTLPEDRNDLYFPGDRSKIDLKFIYNLIGTESGDSVPNNQLDHLIEIEEKWIGSKVFITITYFPKDYVNA